MIGWYPGHMVKAQRDIEKNLPLIDFVIEILDARVPLSSYNPIFDHLLKDKKRYILLTKVDMADEEQTLLFSNYYRKKKFDVLTCNLKDPFEWKKMLKKIVSKEKQKIKKGLIVGVPNVGKSTFINNWVGRRSANVENKVGVTRQIQWHKNKNLNIELLDSAGISMPRFEDKKVAYHLALIGSLRLEVIPHDEIVAYLIDFLLKNYRDGFIERYKTQGEDFVEILDQIGRRYAKVRHNEVDYDLVYELILNDFRKGLLGKVTLDKLDKVI